MIVCVCVCFVTCPLQVTDEEKTQNKALNYIMEHTPIRACAEAEMCHSKWNVIKNSLQATRIDLSAMKLTIVCTSPFAKVIHIVHS